MPTFYFPKIISENYQSFRAILKDDLPDAFPEWERRQSSKKDKYVLEWEPKGVCIDIEINPNEFTGYCDRTRSNRTLEALERLAAEIGTRECK